ncbi:30S ribosomal protein S7 [Candidatus Woesearchaeota archaeon]|nr:30S ribosomal protein S7 [Candidatus Woesearchaeota archaeon]
MIKAFDRWDVEGIKIEDPGLIDVINLQPRIVARTGARYAGKRFHKSKSFIVERLINKLMVVGHKGKKHFKSSGHITGKSNNAYKIIEKTFEIIEKQTKENPIKVFVKAIENAAPREAIVTIEYGGARYPRAVECAPQRRVDVALKHMAQGAYHKTFNAKIKAESALANEIIAAYSLNPNSNALKKKQEVERQADASR